MLMDGYGLRPALQSMAERLAAQGYAVLLPNLLYRQGRAPLLPIQFPVTTDKLPAARDAMLALLANYQWQQTLDDAPTFLAELTRVGGPGPVAIAGYCLGGGLAVRIAAAWPERIVAVAAMHAGRLATDQPDSPHVLVSRVRGEMYFAHADQDASLPPEQIARLDEALAQVSVPARAEVYPSAQHGYTMSDLPAYNAAAAERHWREVEALLARAFR